MASKSKFQYEGSIDLEDFTTTAYIPANGATASFTAFGNTNKSLLQIGSADISGTVTCKLEISVDREYWAVAQENDADIEFSLSSTTPIVEKLEGDRDLYWRVAITIDGNTGIVDYFIKDVK